jgi:hypothetical protein
MWVYQKGCLRIASSAALDPRSIRDHNHDMPWNNGVGSLNLALVFVLGADVQEKRP